MKIIKNLCQSLDSYDSSEYSCLRIKSIKTVCSYLPGNPAIDFMRGTVGFFTGFNHHHQKMFTHFSHVLMADDDTHWLSERSTNGVVLGKMDGWIESHEQEVDRWDGLEIPFSKILEFTRNESSMDYNFIGKNCKHFCYDFRRNVLGHVEDFGTYCQFIESKMN